MSKDLSRRKFVGLSAMASVAAMGGTTFSLTSCKKEETKAEKFEYEAIVIGSGFGGAVSALRLTEKGIETLMLEMGRQYEVRKDKDVFATNYKPDGRACWLKTKTIVPVVSDPFLFSVDSYIGVLDRVEYPNSHIRIYRGNCLGGGSVVYGAMLPYARPEFWDEFFPYIPYDDMVNKWYPKVETVLKHTTVPNDLLQSHVYRYARVGLEHCKKAGMQPVMLNCGVDFNIIRGELAGTERKAATVGDLIYGGNSGYKNSLDRNYIPAALGTGKLTINTQHKVDYIKHTPGEKYQYEVYVNTINEKGFYVTPKVYKTNKVFVNAGVAGTMDILLKSKYVGGLPNLNDEVGKHWGNNGNIMAMRTHITEETGATQCAVPVSAYAFLDNPVAPLLAEQAPFPITGI